MANKEHPNNVIKNYEGGGITMAFNTVNGYLRRICLTLICISFLGVNPVQGADSASKKDPMEWNRIVEAAKKEGKLAMTADPSDVYRRVLVTSFEKKYPEIKIEYTGLNGRDFRPKMLQERKVGQYLWDLRISGIDPEHYDLKNKGYFDPLRSFILPETADDSKWHGGFAYTFADKEQRYFPTALYFAEYRTWINRDLISEALLSSSKQLLDPQLKGKIAILNPVAGSGLAAATQLFVLYGENFLRDLFQKQAIVVTSDKRQLVEWLVRGKYPVVLGLERGFLIEFKKKGLGQNVKPIINSQDDSLKAIHLVNRAPHPSAAKVYINWVLSEEGQHDLVKGLEAISMRKDVEPFDKELTLDPLAVTHRRLYEEKVEIRVKAQKLVNELVK